MARQTATTKRKRISLSASKKKAIMPVPHEQQDARTAPPLLNHEQESYEQMPKHPLDQAVEYIKQHWKEIKTLRHVAEQFDVDPGNLARAFRNTEGATAKSFIDDKRKKHVQARLKSGELLYYEIGYEIGFKQDYQFARWVKRAFGRSLTEMKKKS